MARALPRAPQPAHAQVAHVLPTHAASMPPHANMMLEGRRGEEAESCGKERGRGGRGPRVCKMRRRRGVGNPPR